MNLQQALAFWEHSLDGLNQETLIDCARTLGVEVKRLQAVFQSLCDVWEPVDAHVRGHSETKLGESVAGRALEMLRERDALAAELAKLRAQEPVAYLDYWKSDGTGIVRKQRTTGVPFFNHPIPAPADSAPTNAAIRESHALKNRIESLAKGGCAAGLWVNFESGLLLCNYILQSTPQAPAVPAPNTPAECELLAFYCANRAVLNGAPGELVEVGQCCYGGLKPKRDCAGCAAWKPVAPATAPSVPKKHEIEGQLSLAESEMINAKAWSAGNEAKRHIGFAMTAIGCARALLQSAGHSEG